MEKPKQDIRIKDFIEIEKMKQNKKPILTVKDYYK